MITTVFIAIFFIHSVCGKKPERVFGGSEAEIEEFPFLVSIQDSVSHRCGGCLIDPRHILTAAHCVVNQNNVFNDEVHIYSGTNDLEEMTYRHEEVIMILVLDNYDNRISNDDDIAILILQEPIQSSPVRQPFPYMTIDEPLDGSIALFSGWGFLTPRSYAPSRFLQRMELLILSNQECEEIANITITDAEICTTNLEDGMLLEGDSGGGLIYNDKIIGIASTRLDPVPIQIFARIYYYRYWIEDALEKY